MSTQTNELRSALGQLTCQAAGLVCFLSLLLRSLARSISHLLQASIKGLEAPENFMRLYDKKVRSEDSICHLHFICF
jgi:hypothetical protein